MKNSSFNKTSRLLSSLLATAVYAFSTPKTVVAATPDQDLFDHEIEAVCQIGSKDFHENKLSRLASAAPAWARIRIAVQIPLLTSSEARLKMLDSISNAVEFLETTDNAGKNGEPKSPAREPGKREAKEAAFKDAAAIYRKTADIYDEMAEVTGRTAKINMATHQANMAMMDAMIIQQVGALNSTQPMAVCLDKILANERFREKYFSDIAVFADSKRASPLIAIARVDTIKSKKTAASPILVAIGDDKYLYVIDPKRGGVERIDASSGMRSAVPATELRFWGHAAEEIKAAMGI